MGVSGGAAQASLAQASSNGMRELGLELEVGSRGPRSIANRGSGPEAAGRAQRGYR